MYSHPFLPLKQVPASRSASGPRPGSIPCRPASLPYHAPFGNIIPSGSSSWQVETYVFPAASPRSIAGAVKSGVGSTLAETYKVPPTQAKNGRMSKEELRKVWASIHARRNEEGLLSPDRENELDPLWCTVNRYYVPSTSSNTKHSREKPQKEPLTLVMAHANGFSKEVNRHGYVP